MFIVPIHNIDSISNLNSIEKKSLQQSERSNPFQDIYQNAIQNVKTTDANLNEELYKLSTGQSDDLHNIAIASTKATLSVQMLVQLRNKAMDAYNEVMRMGL